MQNKKLTNPVIISCFFAGCLEMYDFVIFGFLAPVIRDKYLSFLDEFNGLVIAYLLFAVGFICRPIGSIIFGHIGDKYGRKRALVISMSMMGMASLALGLLPKYDDIGVLACYLIALIRVVQGISVGGEYSGAAIYAIEHSNKSNIGAVGSTVLAGTTLGVLLATFVSNVLDSYDLPDYSWRFAFLLGFGLSIIGYFIRVSLSESPIFSAQKTQIKEKPLIYGIRRFKKQFIAAILLSGANNANYYFSLVFIPNYFKTYIDSAVNFNNWMLACFMLLLEPICGWLSDKWGRNRVLIAIYLCLSCYNLFYLGLLVSTSRSSVFGIGLVLLGAVLLSASVATVNIFVLEIFPVECRYSCGALSYSIGAAIFGGTTPLICSLIMEYMGNKPIYFGCYMAAISLVGVLGGLLVLQVSAKKESISILKNQLKIKPPQDLLLNN